MILTRHALNLQPTFLLTAFRKLGICAANEHLSGMIMKTEDGSIAIHPQLVDTWRQYVQEGQVADDSPPPAPIHVTARKLSESSVEILWRADADLQSGLSYVVIQRDGVDYAQYPEKPANPYGRGLFQGMSYHDTPVAPMRAMRFVDRNVESAKQHEYRVIAVNTAGLRSEASPVAKAP